MKNMKRLIAMVLVLCSLMSFVPAMAVAVGEGEGAETPVIVTYDFVLEQTELTLANGSNFGGAQLCGTAASGAIAGYYDSGELNWKYAANNHQTFKTSDSITIGQMLYFGGGSANNPWTGLRMGVKVNGVSSFNGQIVYMIDSVATIIKSVRNNIAKGFILNRDLTLTPCYVAKGQNKFAHGKTIKEAVEALREKIFEDMDTDEAIDKFLETFKQGEKYPGKEFFDWHHYLTGSCLMGRESFVRNHDLDVNDMFTVDEFISICENDYGGDVIKKLKKRFME